MRPTRKGRDTAPRNAMAAGSFSLNGFLSISLSKNSSASLSRVIFSGGSVANSAEEGLKTTELLILHTLLPGKAHALLMLNAAVVANTTIKTNIEYSRILINQIQLPQKNLGLGNS